MLSGVDLRELFFDGKLMGEHAVKAKKHIKAINASKLFDVG